MKVPSAPSLPSATTPEPSTNSEGAMPLKRTGKSVLPSLTTKSVVTPSAAVWIEPRATMPPSRTARPGDGGLLRISLGT